MEKLEVLVALLRLSPEQIAGLPRRIRIAGVLGIAFCWLFLLALLMLAVFHVWRDPSLDHPVTISDDLVFAAWASVLALIGLLSVASMIPSRSARAKAIQIREVALRGDDTVAPVAPDQPASLAGEELLLLPQAIRGLRRANGHASAIFGLIVFLIFIALLVGIFIFIFGLDALLDELLSTNIIFSFVAWVPFLTTFRVFFRVERYLFEPLIIEGFSLLHGSNSQVVSVDDWSIRWRKPGSRRQEVTLPWHEARAFVVLRAPATIRSSALGKYMKSTYMLLAENATFAWEVWPRARATRRAASDQLTRIIAARTKLPLRDLTGALQKATEVTTREEIEEVSASLQTMKSLPRTEQQRAIKALMSNKKDFDLFDEDIERAVPCAGLRGRVFWINALLIVAVMSAAVGGLWQFQGTVANFRDSYYAGLPARVFSGEPLVADSLVADDGQWPVGEPTQTDNQREFFADGSYHITGRAPGYTAYTWMDEPYSAQTGDVAVAVTVMQRGTVNSDNYIDGVGLLLRATETPRESEVVYFVSPTTGDWSLYRYTDVSGNPDDNWNFLAGDTSSAIHTGQDAVNKLLVVIHGDEFICYVNDMFVGSVTDPGAPKIGHMGLYLNEESVEGVYNNFAVYNAPEPPASPLPFGLSIPI